VAHRKADHEVRNQGLNDQEDQEVEKLEVVRRHARDRTGDRGSLSDEQCAQPTLKLQERPVVPRSRSEQ
jgi:hypothetical protein